MEKDVEEKRGKVKIEEITYTRGKFNGKKVDMENEVITSDLTHCKFSRNLRQYYGIY